MQNGEVHQIACWQCGRPLPQHTPDEREHCDGRRIADEAIAISCHPKVWEGRIVERVLHVLSQIRTGVDD